MFERYSSLSGVIGNSLIRLLVALYTAFAIGAVMPVIPISPIPRAPTIAYGVNNDAVKKRRLVKGFIGISCETSYKRRFGTSAFVNNEKKRVE